MEKSLDILSQRIGVICQRMEVLSKEKKSLEAKLKEKDQIISSLTSKINIAADELENELQKLDSLKKSISAETVL